MDYIGNLTVFWDYFIYIINLVMHFGFSIDGVGTFTVSDILIGSFILFVIFKLMQIIMGWRILNDE